MRTVPYPTFVRLTSSRFRSVAQLAALLVMGICLLGVTAADAQPTLQGKWLEVGDWGHRYTNAGSTGNNGPGGVWPAIRLPHSRNDGYHNGIRLWIGVQNWTESQEQAEALGRSNPKTWDHKWAYTEGGNLNQDVHPQTFEMVCKFKEPSVIVDRRPTERVQQVCDRIDPEMKADRKVTLITNTILGLQWQKTAKAFSQEHHDDYHVYEFTFTNNGNVDADSDIELPNQTIEGLYFWYDRRSGQTILTQDATARGAEWGNYDMKDMVRDADLKANFAWFGHAPDFTAWNPLGSPAVDSEGSSFVTGRDTSGQLHANAFYGFAKLHADQSADNASDDPDQPVTQYWMGANAANATGAPPSDLREDMMALHYEWATSGVKTPTHAEFTVPSGDYAHSTNNPDNHSGGVRTSQGYGPYTLEPGESVTVVVVEGAYGLGYDAGMVIGKKFKRLWEQDNQMGEIEFDSDGDGTIESDEVMDKNEWVMTQRDSLFTMFRKAQANYRSGYDIPQPPRPPSRFEVTSDVGGITLEWNYPGSDPAGGFEIYRATNFYQGDPAVNYEYAKVAELDGSVRSHFDDQNVQRGLQYFYYIKAVGAANTDDTGMTPTGKPLKSSRYFTQTYAPATLKRPPGDAISEAVVVPNPYHAGGDPSVGYPGAPRLGFLDIPGQCTIDIYTERGDHLKTIEHTDGSGDEFWDLQTKAQQPVVSGLYVAKITDNNSGETRFIKFVVIR